MAVACALFVDLDGPGLAGVAVGAGLGLLNLGVGAWITTRALERGMKSALGTLLGGFLVRLVLVAVLVVVFHRTEAVDEVAFALTFLMFFFGYLALEVVLVERALGKNGRTA
jgi:hypothetical protein